MISICLPVQRNSLLRSQLGVTDNLIYVNQILSRDYATQFLHNMACQSQCRIAYALHAGLQTSHLCRHWNKKIGLPIQPHWA